MHVQFQRQVSEVTAGWADMPVLVLEKIYAQLGLKERYRCSLVCWKWYEQFYSPRLWEALDVRSDTFLRRRYNPFKRTYQKVSLTSSSDS